MTEHDHDIIAENRPSDTRHDDERIVFEKEYKDDKLTIVACGHCNESGEDFAFEHFRYITETKGWNVQAKAYQWEGAHEQDDLASALIDIFNCDCHKTLAGMMCEILGKVSKAGGSKS